MQLNNIFTGERVGRLEITDQRSIKSFVRCWIDQTSESQNVWFRMKLVARDEFLQDSKRPWSTETNDANPAAAGRRSQRNDRIVRFEHGLFRLLPEGKLRKVRLASK